MMSQLQDLLLPLFVAAVIGGLVGGWLRPRLGRRHKTGAEPGPTKIVSAPLVHLDAQQAVPAPTLRTTAAASSSSLAPATSAPSAPSVLPYAADLLLVDDSAVARVKLRRLFEPAGYSTHVACDGVEALALLEKGRYALMISDLEMPNMDGVTLIKTCLAQAHTARMPMLAISGHENLRAVFNACTDVCGVHRKPWVDDILLSHVATVAGPRAKRPVAAMT